MIKFCTFLIIALVTWSIQAQDALLKRGERGKHKEVIAALQNAIKEDPQDETSQFFLVRTKDEYYADGVPKLRAM